MTRVRERPSVAEEPAPHQHRVPPMSTNDVDQEMRDGDAPADANDGVATGPALFSRAARTSDVHFNGERIDHIGQSRVVGGEEASTAMRNETQQTGGDGHRTDSTVQQGGLSTYATYENCTSTGGTQFNGIVVRGVNESFAVPAQIFTHRAVYDGCTATGGDQFNGLVMFYGPGHSG